VRTQVRIDRRTSSNAVESIAGDEVDVTVVEEAILQFCVDMAGKREANARNRLPCETGVGIVSGQRVEVRTSNTGATADEALKAVIRTEVQHAVQHEAQRADVAAGAVISGVGYGVGPRTAEANFCFQTKHTEIIADHAVHVETGIVIGAGVSSGAANHVDLYVFDFHGAAMGTNVPSVIPRESGRSHRGRRKSCYESKLPHIFPLSKWSLGLRKLPTLVKVSWQANFSG
jgi:hypothetical protein